ncbi:uncharacterized protein EDB91DRAFT_1255429 [Suillus paluster]|uniref:uncharacterized protein n=1 Tax=Suillus paluster TaxID=48578 RepID=UPI001B8629D7|nr:uncharacterized protein EDB91DRAFT_1255429 [Suillus paluster]KAG1724058.1 hypothetical protein EDB91DRAFT_1255429 [Suillus paluster]
MQIPGNLVHTKGNQDALQSLLQHKAIQRLAGFGNSVLYHYSPKVYELYSNTRRLLLEKQPGLAWNFQNRMFPAATFTFGPTVVTLDHTDNLNFTSSMCSITTLGDYDPTMG